MRSFSLIFSAFIMLLTYSVFSAEKTSVQPKKTTTQSAEIKYPPHEDFDMEAFKDIVDSKVKETEKKSKLKDTKGIEYLACSQVFANWCKHPYLEEATRIDKSWFRDISIELNNLFKLKTAMDADFENNNKERYGNDKIQYDKSVKKLREIIAKPPKLSDEEYKKMLEQNKKKYNAKKNKQ